MKRPVPFYVVSNIIKAAHALRFQMECIWKFGSKNTAFLSQCHLDKDDITIRISFIRCLPNI